MMMPMTGQDERGASEARRQQAEHLAVLLSRLLRERASTQAYIQMYMYKHIQIHTYIYIYIYVYINIYTYSGARRQQAQHLGILFPRLLSRFESLNLYRSCHLQRNRWEKC